MDRAALDVALELGLDCGGHCPRGRSAEDGPIPARYPLRETPSPDPAERTAWNVRDSDATLILACGPLRGGTALTLEEARRQGKPCRVVDLDAPPDPEEVRAWLAREGVRTLNVAGPRESQSPGIGERARAFLRALLAPVAAARGQEAAAAGTASASPRRSHRRRPHLLGIDDGAFDKHQDSDVPLVGVVMEGADLVEGVAITRFPVDGADATGFLAEWIRSLRFRPGLQGVVLGGITLAGLAVVDVPRLAEATGLPVLVVNRRDPSRHRLDPALRAAGLVERIETVRRCPPAVPAPGGLWVACAGIDPPEGVALVEAARRKSDLPEPLRLAHLIARAVATGESRGRA